MDTPGPQGAGNPAVIFCSKCGQQNLPSNRFCGQCGNPLPMICPSCGGAEIALASGEWEEAIRWAADAIAQSVLRGRVKYQAVGLETHAKALAALGRKHEAIASLRSAVELARPVGDPAMFLRAAVSLLALDGNDQLLAETRTMARRIIAALPDEEMIRRFKAAEPVRVLGPLTP